MEETIEKACADRIIPGAILHAADREGLEVTILFRYRFSH